MEPAGRAGNGPSRPIDREVGLGEAPAGGDRRLDLPGPPDLDVCWRAYIHRFDIEHTLRFVTHTLGWTTPRVRLPEQADRWAWLVVTASTQFRLARGLVADCRLPWEPPRDPGRLTPTRVRRGFRQLVQFLGTPARAPKPTKAGPGRPKGSRRGPAPRYPAIKKAA